ncbi:MAG: hypothetical protein H0X50_09895 [Nitrosopumilus sp.]|nr:hypothetical protein [Nitrosopumilus sp.]
MNVALITKSKRQIHLKLFDERLKELTEEEFEDIYTLNFFMQTIPKKYNTTKTLIIFNDLEKLSHDTDSDSNDNLKNQDNNIRLILADEENTYFINEIHDTKNN